MRVIDRVRREAVSVAPEETVRGVAELMERAGVGAVVVVEDRRPIGIVTDRDLVRRVLARGLPTDARADGVMTTEVVTIDADADVHDAYELVRRHAVRRLPVVRDGRFVGMVTTDDLLVELAADLRHLGRAAAVELHHPDRDSSVPAVVDASAT